jgi:hypothetical protein
VNTAFIGVATGNGVVAVAVGAGGFVAVDVASGVAGELDASELQATASSTREAPTSRLRALSARRGSGFIEMVPCGALPRG